jgi:hypothetical protein
MGREENDIDILVLVFLLFLPLGLFDPNRGTLYC